MSAFLLCIVSFDHELITHDSQHTGGLTKNVQNPPCLKTGHVDHTREELQL